MNVSQKEPQSLEEILDILLGFDEGWVFRGQCDSSWGLTTSLERIFRDRSEYREKSLVVESCVVDVFKSKIHHYLQKDEAPTSELGWLSMAQHHGAPTRLLDFTSSPLVALFFASRVDLSRPAAFSIWALNFRKINEICNNLVSQDASVNSPCTIDEDPDKFYDIFSSLKSVPDSLAWIGEPRKVNLRLERQGGTFLIPTRIDMTIAESLSNIEKIDPVGIVKIDIQKDLCYSVHRMLKKFGITSSRLFDGVDGLAAEITDDLNLTINKPVGEGGPK